MITKELIDQIEGEATLYFDMKEDRVDFATLSFGGFRGMESILEGKNALDALVITPRVCGICGHSHLLACVRALEDAYAMAGHPVKLNEKIESMREFTLVMEMIQNHLKWLYFTLLPQTPLKGAFGANIAAKAIAVFGGQWPHSSYMLPGGVTSDITYLEKLQVQNYLEELKAFVEKESLGMGLEAFLAMRSCKDFQGQEGDIAKVEALLIEGGFEQKGFGYDQFIIFGEHSFSEPQKLKHTRSFGVKQKFVETQPAYSPHAKSYAKNALYRDAFYEVGPLGRMMALGVPLIKNMHRRYKDSTYTRVMARLYEMVYLLDAVQKLLTKIDVREDSFMQPVDIAKISAEGYGFIEAPRGALMHRAVLEKGVIREYEIITPTQWNIGSSVREKPTPVQKAMMGLSRADAAFVFRSFDVCSVCTTH